MKTKSTTYKQVINGKTKVGLLDLFLTSENFNIGEKLCELRTSFNKTESEIAKAIGMKEEEYKDLEKMTNIDDQILEKIVKALGLPTEIISFIKNSVSKSGNNYLNLGEANNNYIGNTNVFIQSDKESDKEIVVSCLDVIKEIFKDIIVSNKRTEEYLKGMNEKMQNG